MTWQLTDPAGTGVVRERYWVTFQPGEVRVCGSCHGVNQFDQAGHTPPTNSPQALADLLAYWKLVSNGYVPPTATATATGGPATATPTKTPTKTPANSSTPTPTIPNNATPTPSLSPAAIGNCPSGVPITASRLGVRLVSGKLELRGTAVIPKPWSAVDPATNGIHVVVNGLLDATIPGGAGWRVIGSRWVFDDPLGSHGGVRHVAVRNRSRVQDGRLAFTIRAINAASVLPPLDTVQATVTLGTASECAALQWNGPAGVRPRCSAGAAMLVCR